MAKLRVDKIAAPIVKDEFTGSVFFDGTGDYLSIPTSDDFAFGTGDFTIELWTYSTPDSSGNIQDCHLYEGRDDTNSQRPLIRISSNIIRYYNDGADRITGPSLSAGRWYHITVCRNNGVSTLFVDGVSQGTYSDSIDILKPTTSLFIGTNESEDNRFIKGYLSNLRVCKGHAVYTGNFTVPTRELPVHTASPKGVVFPAADNRTVLLACQSSTDATADSSGRHIITANGNVTAADANPGLFRKTNITSTITENTGSVFFDGTGDYLEVKENGSDFDFGEDFTIETWIYFNSITSNNLTDFLGSANNTVYLGSSKSGWIAAYLTLDSTGLQFRLSYQSNSAWEFELGWDYTANTGNWYHVAYTRKGGVIDCYINGVKLARSATVGTVGESATITSSEGFVRVGGGYGSTSRLLNGHLSNVRICKGHAVYKSNFIPPTRELEVHEGPDDDRTVLLACYDGENIFAEKTGKIIAAYGDRTSSPTPTATDSPIGSTTVTPGLTREVDPTAGPTFQGGAGFVSQNWLTLPKGTTTDRFPVFGGVQSGTRGFFAGGYSPSRSNVINYVTVPTLGNAIDFGNLGGPNGGVAGFSDSTRGWIAGGNILPAGIVNVMEYVTIASSGNAVDGGDLITATGVRPGSVANSIRGIVAGGSTPGQVKTIVHHTIQTTGIAQYFGDLTEVKNGASGVMSPTRGVFAGGNTPSGRVDTIEHITIASTGNAVLFGELSLDDRSNMGGASNTVRGLFGGGRNPGDFTHIEYITMATLGNGQDFGDLTQSDMDGDVGAVSNSTRVVFGGGASDELGYVEIATLGNTTEFGKFTVQTTANQDPACFSNGHGGLG